MRVFLLSLTAVLLSVTGFAQITTGAVSTPLCPGSSVSVPYTVGSTYNSGNVFTAQLSNATGSFATPTSIGTLTATGSGTITATIPTGTAAGTGYRIRVVGTSPATTGTDNGSNITISVPPTPSVTISQTPTGSICANTAVTFTATPLNASGPVYQWKLNGLTVAGASGTTYTNNNWTTGDVVSVLMITNTACSTVAVTSNSLTETVVPAPAQPTAISGSTLVCSGQTAIYSVPAVSGATSYIWTLPSGWSGTSTTTLITATVGAITGTSNLTVRAVNSCGTSAPTAQAVTTLSTPVQPSAISGNAVTCQGISNVYSVSAATGVSSYIWTLPSGWTGSSTSNSITATAGANSGTITVRASNNCGSSIVRTLAVTSAVSVPATPTGISGPDTVCAGTTNTYFITPVTGISTYTWTVPNGWIANGGTGTIAISTTAGSASGNVSVTASNSCGPSIPAVLPVTAKVVPVMPASPTGPAVACAGTFNIYRVPPVPGADIYFWTLPNGWLGSSSTDSIAVIVDTASGQVVVTASGFCGTAAVPAILDVKTAPVVNSTVSVTAFPGTTISSGQSVRFKAAPVNGGANPGYQWYKNSQAIAGANADTVVLNGLQTGDQILVRMVPDTACSSSPSVLSSPLTIRVSGSTAVGNVAGNWSGAVQIYPNPNNGSFNLEIEVPQQLQGKTATVQLMSIVGQHVYTAQAKLEGQRLTIPVSVDAVLPTGMYQLRLTAEDASAVHSVMIQR